jgi:transcriptional regulator with XRE-family HTH domain
MGFLRAVGDELRRARQEAGLALRDLNERSGREFKASAVGGYERGERSISLDRFCRLAALYGVAPEGLLGRISERLRSESNGEIVIDIRSVPASPTEAAPIGADQGSARPPL